MLVHEFKGRTSRGTLKVPFPSLLGEFFPAGPTVGVC